MIKRKSLKMQFIITFILIIISSLIATVITYYGGYKFLFAMIDNKRLYPANYFERRIPDIEAYIRDAGTTILDDEESLSKVIPSDGILYQVMDVNGYIIYGTNKDRIINNKEELYKKMNTTIDIGGSYAKIVPIFDSQDKVVGAISLIYSLKPYYINKNDKIWIAPILALIIFSPFIHIIIFTILFSRKLAQDIEQPVNMLIEASKKIKEKDLDFNIDYDADNELGKLCSAFDEMKDELKSSLISQWKIEQDRQEMVESLAHDLKTPLSVIQGYVEALLDDNCNDREKTIKYLNIINENALKSSNLVKEMLFAAELESSSKEINFTQINIESFLLRKKESYEVIALNKKIIFDVNVNYENNKKKFVLIDEPKLERILDNIIMNSIRYTPEYGRITIDAFVNKENIQFKVFDTGNGFSKEDLANIFNKFYKGDKARSSKGSNSGLGLYIAKKLVELHGGNIKAYNLQDTGACIEFSLSLLPH